jgi:tRNA(Ile)-lysidine synthase
MSSTAEKHPLEKRVERFLLSAKVEKDSILVVGASGGPDSTALLIILDAIAAGGSIHACLVDHGMRPRPEVEGDISFVRELCESRGIPLHLLAVPTGECASKAGRERKSPEEAARELRLGLLSRLAGELQAGAVILGHTRDDQVETLVMRVFQGTGISGLSGIRPKRGIFLRPLLSTGRNELLAYLEAKKTGYRSDSTNSKPIYLRNRIRASLIPALKGVIPGFQSGLLTTSRNISMFDDYLSHEAASLIKWKKTERGCRTPFHAFFAAHPALRTVSLLSAYDQVRLPGASRRLSIRALLPVLKEAPPKGREILRAHGIALLRDRGDLVLERDIAMHKEKGYFIMVVIDGSYTISESSSNIVVMRGRGTAGGEGEIEVDVVEPVVIRSRRKGDVLHVENGSRTVNRLFSDWKVKPEERDKIPILADRRGIVAVLGGVTGVGTRVRMRKDGTTGETVVVRVLRAKEMES